MVAFIFALFATGTFSETLWPGFGQIGNWIIQNPANAVSRDVTIMMAIIGVFVGLKGLAGIDRSWLPRG